MPSIGCGTKWNKSKENRTQKLGLKGYVETDNYRFLFLKATSIINKLYMLLIPKDYLQCKVMRSHVIVSVFKLMTVTWVKIELVS